MGVIQNTSLAKASPFLLKPRAHLRGRGVERKIGPLCPCLARPRDHQLLGNYQPSFSASADQEEPRGTIPGVPLRLIASTWPEPRPALLSMPPTAPARRAALGGVFGRVPPSVSGSAPVIAASGGRDGLVE